MKRMSAIALPGVRAVVLIAMLLPASDAASAPLRWRWSNPGPHGGNVFDMTSGYGLVVQVAERGQIYTSEDLLDWIPRESGTTNSLRAVTFFGPRLVFAGENGTVLYADSLDDIRLVRLNTADWLEGLAASPSRVVAVGDNGAIYTSTDAETWQRQQVSFNKWLRGVAYSPVLNAFVAVGEQGIIASSLDGNSWTVRNSGTTRNLNRVAWVSDRFWVVGDGGLLLNNAVGQLTGWTAVTTPMTNNLFAAAGNQPSTGLVVGDQAVQRRQGTTWSDETDPSKAYPAPKWTYYSVLQPGDLYFMAGRSGMMVEGFQTNSTSPWLWANRQQPVRNWLWDVWRAPGFFVAVGDYATILTSDTGVAWDLELPPSPATNAVFLGVSGSTNLLVAAGSQGTIVTSPNVVTNLTFTNAVGEVTTTQVSTMGVLWYSVSSPVTNDLHGVACDGSRWVISGDSGTILTSTDGLQWVRRSTPASAHLSSVTAFGGGFVAVGKSGTILTSPDAVAWTARSSGTTNWLYRVREVKGMLVIVGEKGTILTSGDGVAWTPRSSGTTAWLTDALAVGETVLVCGHQGAVLRSPDLSLWESIGCITEKSLFGLAQADGRVITVGVEGAILRTQVVPDLTPVEFVSFGREGTRNVFLLGGHTDQRFTLDWSNDLNTWTNGPVFEFYDNSGTLLFFEDTGTNAPASEFYRGTLVP